jgi:glycosyltransferase involved in cell wall biosynthesis
VRELNPQKSFFYTIKPVIYGGLALLWQRCCSEHKRQPRSMAMITGLGFAFMDQSLKQKIAGWVARVLYKVALRGHDVLVFENPDDQAFFKEAGLIPGSIEVLRVDGSGVPTEDFPLTSLPFQKVQKGAAVKFLMIARVLRAKGIVEYAEAAALVRSRYREGAEFFYLGGLDPGGDGLSAEEFKTLCQRGSIHYLGEMGDVRPAIASCDVVVLPSYREGLPRSSLEAMAMGRVIVTSDVPGCRETVLHGQNGLLVPVRNARALAEALCQIIETAQHSPEKLHSMAHMSRKLCEERFDIKKVNRDLLGGLGIAYP